MAAEDFRPEEPGNRAERHRVAPVVSVSLVDQVLARLEPLFAAGAFRPGERLNEARLAADMQISRGPLREAARMLAQRGWLVAQANRGFFVRSFDLSEVREIYEARRLLETIALDKALPALSEADAEGLRSAFAVIEERAAAPDDPAFISAIMDFHRKICALGRNRVLLRAFDEAAHDTMLMIAFIGGVKANPDEFVRRNRRILDHLLTRDAEAAVREIGGYLDIGLSEVEAFIAAQAETPAKPMPGESAPRARRTAPVCRTR